VYNEKAHELGKLLGQTPEFQALQRARDAMKAAGDLRLKLDRMEALAQGLQEQVAGGTEPEPEQVEEYNRVFGELQSDARYQQLAAAQSNFEKLMMQVNERIMEGMQKGAESSIITLS
jgi:cell fate (sporulation/competence/biofilm development) regulator YlbF (YheA/YmcA/DUF963 family)